MAQSLKILEKIKTMETARIELNYAQIKMCSLLVFSYSIVIYPYTVPITSNNNVCKRTHTKTNEVIKAKTRVIELFK